MTRRPLLLMALLALLLALAAQRPRGEDATVSVQLLAFNDFHGNLEPPTAGSGLVNQTEAGGAEYLATHLKNAIAQNPNSLVVAAGDVIGASPLISSWFHDEPTIEAMNAMNLAVTSVGNHEFDEGPRELLRMKRGRCHPTDGCQDGDGFSGATFQYLSANAVGTANRAPLLPATAVRTVGGVKIGFIGETLRGTKQLVAPAGTRGVTFLDEASTANAYAAQLKRQGIHAIVLLIHEGGRQRPDHGDLDPNGCANFTGPIDAIARKLTADIPVIISGHAHTFYNCTIAGHLVTNAGSYGRAITRINLTVDRRRGTIAGATAVNQIVTRDVVKDPAQTAIIAKYGALSSVIGNKVSGSVTGDILRKPNAAGESALGDVIADALLAATGAAADGGAVVAFMNPGGIRADLPANTPRPTARPGEVTFADLYSVQPFGNNLNVVTMTGDMIKRLLEQQFDNASAGEQEILQISNGFTYRFRLSAPAGQHVDAASIAIGGRRIGPTDRVRVAASEFVVGGGDNFTVFGEGTNLVVASTDIEALLAYFRTGSPVAPGPQDRIIRTD